MPQPDMVLILTHKDDAHADYLIPRLRDRDVRVTRYDTADFPLHSALTASLSRTGWAGTLSGSADQLRLDEVLSVWYRRPTRFRFDQRMPGPRLSFLRHEALMGMGGVLRSLPCHWVNHPDDLVRAEYKPFQLALAARHGLRVPRTMITNSPTAARAFYEECSGRVVYKSLGAGIVSVDPASVAVVYTSQVQPRDLLNDDALRATACLYQEHIAKRVDLRITVVGETVFAVSIHSQEKDTTAVDWRRDQDDLRHTPCELPESVRAQCMAVVRDLRLSFAAIDMILTPGDEYVFLEVNPNGQWAWLDHVTDLDIRSAMADELTLPRPFAARAALETLSASPTHD